MKYAYILEMKISQCGELINTIQTGFDSQELAQKVLEKTKLVNDDSRFEIEYFINKIKVYENEQEVPILNK